MCLAGQRKLLADAKASAKAAVKAGSVKAKAKAKGGKEFLMKTDKRQGVTACRGRFPKLRRAAKRRGGLGKCQSIRKSSSRIFFRSCALAS